MHHSLRKLRKQRYDASFRAETGIPKKAVHPLANEALIARSRGFRYNVPVALEETPEALFGTVVRVSGKNPRAQGACMVYVRRIDGAEVNVKPSAIVPYKKK